MVSLPVSEIAVGERHRKDMGDIGSLADSIQQVGLLHPVVITSDHRLIAGARRLAAAQMLGWETVPVNIVPMAEIIRGELDENAIRKDFAPSEIVTIKRAIERVVATPVGRPGKENGGNFPPIQHGKTRDKVGAFVGVSGRTVDKMEAVVAAAEKDPKRFGHLVDEMDRTGKAGAAYRKIRMAEDEERVLSLEPIKGKHKTLIFDPPWDYEWLSLAGRAAPGYATMSHAELLALDVSGWAEDNCHLYLWTTNNFLTRAVDLMAAWGFQHKTVLTWVKPRIGLGSYFRNTTEQVLFGVRGDLTTRVDNIPTHFEAPTTGHSEKPDVFYDLVRRASYPSYGEGFQRQERDGFSNLFGEQETS
jgi:N6-adenosine-specific RNA methylase IME4